jgi:4-nitrophenyl phosphatase
MNPLNVRKILASYDGILLDAYGVLVDASGALEHAREFLEFLVASRKPHLVLTNAANKTPDAIARCMAQHGLSVRAENVLTSGSLVHAYFAEEGLKGARALVIGTGDAPAYVEVAGGKLCPLDDVTDGSLDVLVLADCRSENTLAIMDRVTSAVFRAVDAGRRVHVVVPNPDVIYPKGQGEFGYTGGALGRLLVDAIGARYGSVPEALSVAWLGKPHGTIFEMAAKKLATKRLLMIGDQVGTDVLGAKRFGIDSVLVTGATGVLSDHAVVRPTYVLPDLRVL